jgi:hypothetical protein
MALTGGPHLSVSGREMEKRGGPAGAFVGRKLSGPRKEKEKGGKNSPALGWAERRRERKRGFCYFFPFLF